MEEPAELLYEGTAFHVYVAKSGERCPYWDFLHELRSAPQRRAKIKYWVERIGDEGLPASERKWHRVHADANLFVLKPDRQVRLVCFLDRDAHPKRIVITHGFFKTTADMPPNERTRGLNARGRYFESKGQISDEQIAQR